MSLRLIIGFSFAILALSSCNHLKTDSWPNGSVKSEIQMKGDLYEGPAKFWYSNGILQMECNYKNNKLEGKAVRYYQNGFKEEELTYSAGELNGINKCWDQRGNLVKECSYKNGKLNGPYHEWHGDNILSIDGQYKDGNIDGQWLYFDIYTKVIGEGRFINGTGIQKSFFENGKTKQITHYENNLKEGDEMLYNPDGNVNLISHYESGKLVNTIKK